ncbi:MAG: redox-sensitive bicupin YhaK (pirin superfamily) [Bacteroidia bacterium]|jgi:redox-sensitive bicupin YhaK (pirin superfamily)
MIKVHRSDQRGRADYGWLQANYSFSFAQYYDPQRLGFRSLRVLNEDHILGGGGFPSHSHRDMEILTYIIDGTLEHVDSMGNREVIEAGEFQMMSAGTGVVHSEANASQTEPLHLFQIWIEPATQGLDPGYKQMRLDGVRNELRPVVVPTGDRREQQLENVMHIHQDVKIFSGQIDAGETFSYQTDPTRGAWIQVAKGTIELNGERLEQGDGCEVHDEVELQFMGATDAEFLLFDLS